MIIVTSKEFSQIVKSKLQKSLVKLEARLTKQAQINVSNRLKNSQKALRQSRRKDGRFAKPLPKPSDIRKNPLVTFFYPHGDQTANPPLRMVRLISAKGPYYIGLEFNGRKWQYKKFIKGKTIRFEIVEFNMDSMS